MLIQLYDPIDESARPLLPLYIIITFLCIVLTILLFKKYHEKKNETTKWLFLAFLMYSLLLGIILAGFLEMYLTGFKKELYRFSLAAGYAGIMVANCCLIMFGVIVFQRDENRNYAKKYIIISLAIAVLVALPINYYGTPSTLIPPQLQYFRTVTSALMMFFSIFTYSKIYKEARRVSRLLDDRWAKTGLNCIAYSQLSLIFFFIFTLADVILFSLTELKGYTPFIYVAWSLVAVFLVFSYLGLIMPQWFKDLLERRKK